MLRGYTVFIFFIAVTVILSADRTDRGKSNIRLEIDFYHSTSCGLCGKYVIQYFDLYQLFPSKSGGCGNDPCTCNIYHVG